MCLAVLRYCLPALLLGLGAVAWADSPPVLLQVPAPVAPDSAHALLPVRMQALVSVDDHGHLVQVLEVVGPPVLSPATVAALEASVFAPAMRDGVPVAGSMWVDVVFEAFSETGDEYVVRADAEAQADTHARTELSTDDLDRTASKGLAEAVAQVPGVQVARTSGSAAKPIIRGHSERRLLLLYDGVRHESQKWGPDHAPEVDPFSAGEVTVIKGAAGARFGPDAIGGVVLVRPPAMRAVPGVGGRTLLRAATNGRLGYAAGRVDVVPRRADGLSFRVEGTGTSNANYKTPTYVLGNTAAQQWTGGTALQYSGNGRTFRLSFAHFSRKEGVFYGVHTSTPEEFQAAWAAGQPATAAQWTVERNIDRPYQEVHHNVVSAHFDADLGAGWMFHSVAASQFNHRWEYAQVRDPSAVGAQYDFTLRTHSLDLHATSPSRVVGNGRVDAGLGAQASLQENVYDGYALIPNYRSLMGGVFGHAAWTSPRAMLSAGARYDHLARAAYLKTDDFARHEARETLDSSDCTSYTYGRRCDSQFDTGSVSVGGLVHLVPDHLDARVDVSSASRFPSIDEQYLLGSAPSLPVFALGQPNLSVETTWGISPTFGLRLPSMDAEVSGFANRVENFVYFAPALGSDGFPTYSVTIEGTWPEYTFSPIMASFRGIDGYVSLGPEAVIGLNVSGAMVRAEDRATGQQLVGTPPDRASATIVARPPEVGSLSDWDFGVRVDAVAKQTRTLASVDLIPAPDGVVLLGAVASAAFDLKSTTGRVTLSGTNLLNTEYREYNSLLRYYANQPGRDISIQYGMDF